jgi:hypothetical protein
LEEDTLVQYAKDQEAPADDEMLGPANLQGEESTKIDKMEEDLQEENMDMNMDEQSNVQSDEEARKDDNKSRKEMKYFEGPEKETPSNKEEDTMQINEIDSDIDTNETHRQSHANYPQKMNFDIDNYLQTNQEDMAKIRFAMRA